MALLIAALAALLAPVAAGAKAPAVRWMPDLAFAHRLVTAFDKANTKGRLEITEVACRKPSVAANVAVVLGIPNEDCLMIAEAPTSMWCGEVLVSPSGPQLLPLPCVTIAKTLKQVKPADVLNFKYAPEA
jgi:hypothetical protein